MELELLIGLGLLVTLVVAVYLMNKAPSITAMDDVGVIKTELDEVREEVEETLDLNAMTKKELIALAESKDVLVSARMRKAEIISKLLQCEVLGQGNCQGNVDTCIHGDSDKLPREYLLCLAFYT